MICIQYNLTTFRLARYDFTQATQSDTNRLTNMPINNLFRFYYFVESTFMRFLIQLKKAQKSQPSEL